MQVGAGTAYRAFTYAGCLSGWAWGLSRHVASSVNALTASQAGLGLGINSALGFQVASLGLDPGQSVEGCSQREI